MSPTMVTQFACILVYAGGPITGFEIILFFLFAGAVMLVGLGWQLLDNWKKRTCGRKWPIVPAFVNTVSVAFVEDKTPHYPPNNFSYYLATLTYFYNSPEKQMGDFSRRFGTKDDAEAWANSYKGETIKVHVDPRDPTRSALREEDL